MWEGKGSNEFERLNGHAMVPKVLEGGNKKHLETVEEGSESAVFWEVRYSVLPFSSLSFLLSNVHSVSKELKMFRRLEERENTRMMTRSGRTAT